MRIPAEYRAIKLMSQLRQLGGGCLHELRMNLGGQVEQVGAVGAFQMIGLKKAAPSDQRNVIRSPRCKT